MKKLIFCLAVIFIFPAIGFCAETSETKKPPLTLIDCYRLALKQSEIIAIDAESITIAEAHFLQAFGILLPQVSFSHAETRNHSSVKSFNKTYEAKFTFTQELFSGFKEFAGMRSSNFEKSQRQNQKWRAEQLLFVDVSNAFYLLLEFQEDIKALKTSESALKGRVKELKARQAIGKSKTSEVVTTEYQLYNIHAQIEQEENQALIVRQLLEFLVGRPVYKVGESEFDFKIKSESQYLSEAASRPDVQAANFTWKSDLEKITIARSGFLPQINLQGDYYSHRSSAPSDSKWDGILSVNVPIFEGTTVYGQVKEAKSVAKQSELLYSRAGRLALQDIQDAFVNMQTYIIRKRTLRRALKAAELSYYLQAEDYKLNVVNNLDVLTAIQNLEDIRRNYIHTSYEGKRFYWRLLVAAGELDTEKIIK